MKKNKNKNRDRTLERWTWNPVTELGFLFVSLACDACCLSSIHAIMQLIASD